MKKYLLGVVTVSVCLMLVSGCQVAGKEFGFNGLPKEQYRVGGGFDIEYTAPQDGTCYLVDQQSGRFFMTRRIAAGDMVDIDIPVDLDESVQENIDLSKVKLAFYFVPAQKKDMLESQTTAF